MSTETQCSKVQQGPNLRAAIAMLPSTSHLSLNRRSLAGRDAMYVLDAAATELSNIAYRIRAIDGSHDEFRHSSSDELLSGISYLCDDARSHVENVQRIVSAVYRDSKGYSVPEDWS